MGLWDSFLNQFQTPYELEDLLRASAEVLGRGTYGAVYKVSMDSEMAVVVKRLRDLVVPEEEFKAKMEEIGRLDHENLLPLKAFYFSSDEKLLIYDFFPLGSLNAVLHDDGKASGTTPLNWETRAKIALGTARGIQHIHSQGPTRCHGNIKSSNIFLSKNYEARVSDLGLAQVLNPRTPLLRAAVFYHAPEARGARDSYMLSVSQKADVYSFGVLLMELLTRKAPVVVNGEGLDLPRWVQSVAREELSSELFDIQLLTNRNVLFEKQMDEFLQLALECTALNPDDRPIMADITTRIERICGCTSNSEKPHKRDPNPKAAPQDLSLPPRNRGSS